MANGRREQLCLLAELIGLRQRGMPFVDDYIDWLQTTIATHPHSLHVSNHFVFVQYTKPQIRADNVTFRILVRDETVPLFPDFKSNDRQKRINSSPKHL